MERELVNWAEAKVAVSRAKTELGIRGKNQEEKTMILAAATKTMNTEKELFKHGSNWADAKVALETAKTELGMIGKNHSSSFT